ncbi:MAG: hypothetical protein Q9227_008451 [Pyrenula ochraceoflavens]
MAQSDSQSFPGPRINASETLVNVGNSDSLGTRADYDLETTNVSTSAGVTLDETQKLLTGSVLDFRRQANQFPPQLFLGKPSKKKLSLWSDDATFEDPLTVAKGRKQYEAQWYGLEKAFSEIERLDHRVTSAGNPIDLDLKTRYKIAGVGKEQVVESKVKIFTEGSKISKVQDRWNDELPEGSFKNAFRKLNAVTVPTMVGVPKSESDEAAKSK